MIIKCLLDQGAERATYLVGHASTGEAVLIDPSGDVAAYVAEAKQPETRRRRAEKAPAGIRTRSFPR